MAYVVLLAGHDPDLLARWENLLFAAGFEVVSATDPAEPLHAIFSRASELEQLSRSMRKEERPLGLVMRASEPCAPVVMIADHAHVHYLELGELADGIPEEIVAPPRRSLSS